MTGQLKIAVLGAGMWGCTLSWLLSSNGKRVALWDYEVERINLLKRRRRVVHPVKITLPELVQPTADLAEAVDNANIILLACTSQTMRELVGRVVLCTPLREHESGHLPVLVSVVKGLELTTLYRMTQVVSEIAPDFPVCALSGPNLAVEVLKGLPTATVIAGQSASVAAFVQKELNVPTLRMYTNSDVAGVELGGSLKNVIAIAAGASDGLELGANAKGALLTRGLAEITRLSVALGAQKLTLAGLSGMGDLFATCTSPLSRNYRLGRSMAIGLSLEEARRALGSIAEGVTTTEAVCGLSKKLGIDMPIAEQVQATLTGATTPKRAIMSLMMRPLVSE